jgi:hypothetical protein
MRVLLRAALTLLSLSPCTYLASGQEKAGYAGHWEGVVKAPSQEIKFSIDVAKNEKGVWIGSIAMASSKGIQLSDIVVKGDSVTFKIPVSGGPVFEGKLSEDEKTVTGTLTQGGETVPFELKRAGEAKVELPPKSSQIAEDFMGNWEGTLQTPGSSLRLVLKLSKAADGTAAGVLDSLDQNASIPIDVINQEGSSLNFEIRLVDGTFAGKLNEAKTELSGEWSQGGMKLPLTLKKSQQK